MDNRQIERFHGQVRFCKRQMGADVVGIQLHRLLQFRYRLLPLPEPHESDPEQEMAVGSPRRQPHHPGSRG